MEQAERSEQDKKRLAGGSKNLFYREEDIETLPKRVDKIRKLVDLRPTDHVLDAGCAEGLITLELAPHVEHVHGFDLSELRIETARRLAEERGITNATFEVESVIGYPAAPLSYDVTIFAGVWGSRGVSYPELENLLNATRRQLFAYIEIGNRRKRVPAIFEVCDRAGFDVMCFPGKFVIAVRRGADCVIPELPMVAVLPTSFLRDDPIVRRAAAIEYKPDNEAKDETPEPDDGSAPAASTD